MKRLALGLLLLTPALAGAQSRGIYLASADEKDERLLEALASEDDPARAAELADRLLSQAASPKRGNGVVERGPFLHRGLRAEVLRQVEARLSRADALRTLQTRLAEGAAESSQLSPAQILRRFPLADAAADAALALWARASERGDHPACFALLASLRRWHPDRLKTPAALARQAQLLAHAGERAQAQRVLERLDPDTPLAKRTTAVVGASPAPTPTAPSRKDGRLREIANRSISARQEEGVRSHSPAHAVHVDQRIVVSNGAQVSVFDLDGQPLASIPAVASGATDVPPDSSGFEAQPVARPGVVYTPLVIERWLAPGRAGSMTGDPAIAGRFYALLALDPERAKVLWWDGDAGAQGQPPGWSTADPKLRAVLRRGHTVAVACDEGRVYVALTLKGEEPELWLFAYEGLGSNGELALRAAWAAPTYLLSSERTRGSAEEEPVAAEVVASLTPDGRGRLLCTTNLGLMACLNAATGDLLWAREPPPDPRRRGGFRLRSSQRGPEPPPEPARLVTARNESCAIFFSGSQLLCARLSDGSTVWQRERGATERVLVLERQVVAYGGRETMVCSSDGTLLQQLRGILHFPVVGRAAVSEGLVFFPTLKGGNRPVLYLERCQARPRGLALALNRSTQALSTVTEPVNLRAIPGGLVATSRSRALFLRWE